MLCVRPVQTGLFLHWGLHQHHLGALLFSQVQMPGGCESVSLEAWSSAQHTVVKSSIMIIIFTPYERTIIIGTCFIERFPIAHFHKWSIFFFFSDCKQV